MLLSATTRGTLPAATELVDGALHVGLCHADLSRAAGALTLEPAPAFFLPVAAQRLAKSFGLGTAFLLGQTLSLTDHVRGKGQRADSCGRNSTVGERSRVPMR